MGPKAKALLLALLLVLVIGRLAMTGMPTPPARLPTGGAEERTIQAWLLEDPRLSAHADRCRVLAQLRSGERVELVFEPCEQLQQGWQVEARGRLREPQPAPHPLLARKAAWNQLRVEQVSVLARPPTPIADLRRQIALRLQQQAGPETGGVLGALVLGSAVVPVPAAVRDSFRAAGLSHALAASGFHLSVLLGAVLIVGRRLGRPLRLTLAAGAMLLFLLLAGPQPSVLRAVGMGAVALVLLEGGKRSRPLLVLAGTCAALLLWRPEWLLDVGFQLSVAATAGLVVTARPLEEALARRSPRWLAAAAAVPLAAFVWTLPLQLLHFGVVPLYSVPANLLAAPLLTPLTLGAMALGVLAVLMPPALPLLLPPVGALTSLLIRLTQGFAALPMAQWQLGRPEPLLVLLLAAATLVLALPQVRGRWRLAAAGAIALVVAVHLLLLRGDQLLLVHQGRGDQRSDLLLARHQGRAALVSTAADGWSCSQATRLAQALGVQRFDWALLLDPLPPEQPACWHRLAGVVVASGDGSPALLLGQRLISPALEAQPLAMEARATALRFGDNRWLLLPDRQSLWAWQQVPAAVSPQGVWLGFRPTVAERRQLGEALDGSAQRWFSGPAGQRAWPGWWSSGSSGSLLWDGRSSHRLSAAADGTVDP